MEYSYLTLLIIAPLVFLGGMVDAIAGGGGLIALPAYVIAGFSPLDALATNKMSSCIGMTMSTSRLIKNGCMDWPIALPSALLGICGGLIGSSLVLMVKESVIRYFMLIALPLVAVFVLKKRDLDNGPEACPFSRSKQLLIALVASLLCGVYDGFYGPGAGTFMLLAYTQLAKMSLRAASGNMKVVNLASNFGALLIYLINGQVIVPIGLIAALFGIAGHYIGAGLLLKKGTRIVRPVIFSVIGLLFVRVLYDLITKAS